MFTVVSLPGGRCCSQNFGSRESHFELIFTGSNFHHSTTPAGHLIAKLDRIWGVLDPTCGSHMTGLGGARTASDDQGRLGWQWWPPKSVQPAVTRAELPGPILPNIGPQLLPTDILYLWYKFSRIKALFWKSSTSAMGILLLIVAKHVLHILDDMFCKVTLSVTYNIYWIFELNRHSTSAIWKRLKTTGCHIFSDLWPTALRLRFFAS